MGTGSPSSYRDSWSRKQKLQNPCSLYKEAWSLHPYHHQGQGWVRFAPERLVAQLVSRACPACLWTPLALTCEQLTRDYGALPIPKAGIGKERSYEDFPAVSHHLSVPVTLFRLLAPFSTQKNKVGVAPDATGRITGRGTWAERCEGRGENPVTGSSLARMMLTWC